MAHLAQEQIDNPSPSQIAQPVSPHQGDHERLFRLLEKDGPAPDEFMLSVSDPMIGRENIFEDWDDS